MNTEVKDTNQEDFERFLSACWNAADDVDCVVGNMGFDDLAHGGPGPVKRYVHLWETAGQPDDGEPGTGGLEIALGRTQAVLRSMGIDDPVWQDRLERLKEQAREFKKSMA